MVRMTPAPVGLPTEGRSPFCDLVLTVDEPPEDRATTVYRQIWLLPTGGGEARPVTDLPFHAGAPVWSPDGTRLAFTALVAPQAFADGACFPADSDQVPIVVARLDSVMDGVGDLGERHPQVFVLDLGSGAVHQLTAGPTVAAAPTWSPDSRWLAYPASVSADTALDPASAPMLVAVGDPESFPTAPERVGDGRWLVGALQFTSDALSLLMVGRLDTEVGHNRLLRVWLDGAPPLELTAGLDRNVMLGSPGYPGAEPQIDPSGTAVVFAARDGGCTHLYRVRIDGSAPPEKILGGVDRSVMGAAMARDCSCIAALVATPESPGELVVLTDGVERQLTKFVTEDCPDLEVVPPIERTWRSKDGTTIHGLLLRDPGAEGPSPLLLDVHGGPHNAWAPVLDTAHLYHHELVAAGWTVLLVNPRGSDGYGESFFRAVVGGWGTADVDDLLGAVDALVAEGVADPDQLAVSGYSYGGYAACLLPTMTDRFSAAVAGGCVSDLQSMAGTSDVGHFLQHYELEPPWDSSARYEKRSPIARGSTVSTPTLLLHGEADRRCPIGQAEQWFATLRGRGVPTRLVRYPGASHLFILEGRPSHREHAARELLAWLDRYVGPKDQR